MHQRPEVRARFRLGNLRRLRLSFGRPVCVCGFDVPRGARVHVQPIARFTQPARLAGVEHARGVHRIRPGQVQTLHAVFPHVHDLVTIQRGIHGFKIRQRHLVPQQPLTKRARQPQRQRLAVVKRHGREAPERREVLQVLGGHLAGHGVRVEGHPAVVGREEEVAPIRRRRGDQRHPLPSHRRARAPLALELDEHPAPRGHEERAGLRGRRNRAAVQRVRVGHAAVMAQILEGRRALARERDARQPRHRHPGVDLPELPAEHLQQPLPLDVQVQVAKDRADRVVPGAPRASSRRRRRLFAPRVGIPRFILGARVAGLDPPPNIRAAQDIDRGGPRVSRRRSQHLPDLVPERVIRHLVERPVHPAQLRAEETVVGSRRAHRDVRG
mmetsp:Transcript_6693/g.27265  ORF Transcript_6693/g.27265 Transcript_6693/m.27265 type:complete len:384 (+) Transcript_6693:1161-2312(+)